MRFWKTALLLLVVIIPAGLAWADIDGAGRATVNIQASQYDDGGAPLMPVAKPLACSDTTSQSPDAGLSWCVSMPALSGFRIDTNVDITYRTSYLADAGAFALSTDKAVFAGTVEIRRMGTTQSLADAGAILCILQSIAGQSGVTVCP